MCAIKLDMKIAYDIVEWSFLEKALQSFFLPSQLVHLIMACVTIASYSLVINGESTRIFKLTQGICQDDHLSS